MNRRPERPAWAPLPGTCASASWCRRWALLCIFGGLCASLGCNGEDDAIRAAAEARLQAAARNQCASDAECRPTGCRQQLCRAMDDPSFCEHQIVVRIDGAEVRAGVEALVAGTLNPTERESLTVSGDEQHAVIAFHAPVGRRERVESLLGDLAKAGFFAPLAQSEALAEQILAELEPEQRQRISGRRIQGGPLLLEAKIFAGDILSKNDVLDGARFLGDAVADRLPAGTIMAFETLARAKPPVVRLWLLDPAAHLPMAHLRDVTVHYEGDGFARISGEVEAPWVERLAELSRDGAPRLLPLVIGDWVIVAPLLRAPITDGRFVIRFLNADSDDNALQEALQRLEDSQALLGRVAIDVAATAKVEAVASCVHRAATPSQCACVEGHCQWLHDPAVEACLAGQ